MRDQHLSGALDKPKYIQKVTDEAVETNFFFLHSEKHMSVIEVFSK